MSFSHPLVILSGFFAALALIFFVFAVGAIRSSRVFGTAAHFVMTLLMLAVSALFGTISIATQGYRALTREDVAATVRIEPIGEQQFNAKFVMSDGREKTFSITGDQLYVDAHILKWKPLANMFGLHTSYEFDRVAGRYQKLSDEITKPRTVYAMSDEHQLNMYDLRQKFAMLDPLLDAEYGSATFIDSKNAGEFKVLVSTTGLLIRKVDKQPGG